MKLKLIKTKEPRFTLLNPSKREFRRKRNYSTGFSLVELVVVIALLALITIITASLFLSMVRSQKRILAEQELLNQISYVIEYMSRAIRMANKDTEGGCIGLENILKSYVFTSNDIGIKFINNSGKKVCQNVFWDATIKRISETRDVLTSFLTSESLQINSFKINIYEDDLKDNKIQPRATIFIDVQVRGTSGSELRRVVQTTISQRNLNLPD